MVKTDNKRVSQNQSQMKILKKLDYLLECNNNEQIRNQ